MCGVKICEVSIFPIFLKQRHSDSQSYRDSHVWNEALGAEMGTLNCFMIDVGFLVGS